jgi:spore maturation protein CgeB
MKTSSQHPHTYVINLRDATARMAHMDLELKRAKLDYTRIEAVLGDQLPEPIENFDERKFNDSEQAELYRSHIAVFNPLQASNTIHGLNLRAFEAPLCGAIVTYQADAEDLTSCFEPDTKILSYLSLQDLKSKVEELSKAPERMTKMREAGRARVLSDHTFKSRAQKIITDWLQ